MDPSEILPRTAEPKLRFDSRELHNLSAELGLRAPGKKIQRVSRNGITRAA